MQQGPKTECKTNLSMDEESFVEMVENFQDPMNFLKELPPDMIQRYRLLEKGYGVFYSMKREIDEDIVRTTILQFLEKLAYKHNVQPQDLKDFQHTFEAILGLSLLADGAYVDMYASKWTSSTPIYTTFFNKYRSVLSALHIPSDCKSVREIMAHILLRDDTIYQGLLNQKSDN